MGCCNTEPNPDAGFSAGDDKWIVLLSRERVFLKELKDNAVRVEGNKAFLVCMGGRASFSLVCIKRLQKINQKSQPYAQFQEKAELD